MRYRVIIRYDWGYYPLPGLLPILDQEFTDWSIVEALLRAILAFPCGTDIQIEFLPDTKPMEAH